jgi:hypothetical protein
MTKLNQNQKVDVLLATKMYEDKLIERLTEPVFDEWLDRIPLDVDPVRYCAILAAMLNQLRKHRKPELKQINLILDLGFANLKYNQG